VWCTSMLRSFNWRKVLIVCHDLFVSIAAVLAAFYLRFEEVGIAERRDFLTLFLPPFMVYCGIVYYFFGLYASKWRFASLPDLANILRAVSVLAVSLVVLDYVLASTPLYGRLFFGKVTIALYWALQICFLGGPRVAYRYFRFTRTRRQVASEVGSKPSLILGRAADAELLLRAIESGAVRKIWPLGILSPSQADQGTVVRNVRILGTFENLEQAVSDLEGGGTIVKQIILTPSALEPAHGPDVLISRARQLGIDVRQAAGLDVSEDANPRGLRVAKIDVEDLLLRPSVKIDYRRLENFAQGKSVIVTGGGGSIGAEICNRLVTFGVKRLLIVENSESALHAALDNLRAIGGDGCSEGRIADVRDRKRMFRIFSDFEPDIVFHAAALKHVNLVEKEWTEGVKTNVLGSINVADAAVAAGARAMVMISTDKAIAPVSVLGATKRLAEIYCRALDADLARRRNDTTVVQMRKRGDTSTRLISVRFGNVLASNGSVVPKFKAQIEAGGPVTVTHPDMVRYFMTVREASDLVMTSASHAFGDNAANVSVYVLNMGQPVKIVDLAERMIRLSGYEPGEDIEIVSVGMRDGERLNEVLFAEDEPTQDIGIAGIVAANPPRTSLVEVKELINRLERALEMEARDAAFEVFRQGVQDFQGTAA
jgi:FlaA1/EpsC-like NDP-sugar epimerase